MDSKDILASNSSPLNNRATHPRLHIRNAHEAHTLFEAVRLGLLPIVRRRLSPTDRELSSGEVFVWEEASYKGGLERWTDGRKWSQSRMREPFLFYEEKAMPTREEKDAKAARRARKSSDPASPIDPPSPTPRRQDRPTKVKGLTKQTYSAYVKSPGTNAPPKKWHLTAYFCSSTYHELPVVTDDPVLRTITVPQDVYVTGKGLTRKNNQRGVGSSSATPTASSMRGGSPPPRTGSSYESASHYLRPSMSSEDGDADGSRSPWSSSSDANSVMPITPPLHTSSLPFPSTHSKSYPHHHPHAPHPQYYAPQPQYPVYETAVPAVFDATPRPASALPPLRRSPSEEDTKAYYPQTAVPPHASTYPQYPPATVAAPAPQYPPTHSPTSQHTPNAAVSYPSSDVRGEYYSPPRSAPAPPPSTSPTPRYSARHSLDQRALGAFRLTL